jgi:hypothetical protein
LLALLAGACAPPPAPTSQRDVDGYLQKVAEWAPQEAEVARAVRRILETQFVDEAEVRRQIAESLPRLERQVAAMRAYQPHGVELEEVHQDYLRSWQALRAGYADVAAGLDTGDQAALGRGRRALVAWRESLPATASRLRELSESTKQQGPPT